MDLATFKRVYLIGAVIVWVGLILAIAGTLAGTSALPIALILLGGGSFWFVVLVPGVLRTVR
ncbi:MAG: hypothetical protein ACYC4L_07880 [Chloroflexota bacterium]